MSPSSAQVAVVIVNYASSELVLKALPGLIDELSAFARGHVFIVDNASPGGDGDRLAEGLSAMGAPDACELILSPVNGGFSAGNNLGFAAIRKLDWQPDAILLLNPDAEVQPGAIAEMLRVLQSRPEIGFVGPRLINPDGSSWMGAFNFPSFGTEVWGSLGINAISRHFPRVARDSDRPVRVDWITGTAMLIRREAWQDLGDMDEGYFLYYEEVDYMFQGARRGWQSWHAPQARIAHVGGAATGIKDGKTRKGRQPAYLFQSWARYFAKNHGALYARATAGMKLLALLLAHLHRSLRGKDVGLPEKFYGDFLRQVVLARLSPPPAAPQPGASPL